MKSNQVDHVAGDRTTKQFVVASLCFIGVIFAGTVCVLSLRGFIIPDALDRLCIFVLGGMSGLLSKTSVDQNTKTGVEKIREGQRADDRQDDGAVEEK